MRQLKRFHVPTNDFKGNWTHFYIVKRCDNPLSTSCQIKFYNVSHNGNLPKNTNDAVSSVENKIAHPGTSMSSTVNASDVSKNQQLSSLAQAIQQVDQQTPSKPKKHTHWKEIFRTFSGFIWPKGSSPEARGTKLRLTFAMSCLIASKLFNVVVPYLFKATIDSFTIPQTFAAGLVIGPASLVLAYGAARLGSSLFSEVKNAAFASVAQKSVTRLATRVFEHLHNMDLRYHSGKKSGTLSMIIDKGRRGATFIMTSMIFNVIPTAFEFIVVTSILYHSFGPAFALVGLSTMAVYSGFTILVTEYRTKYRKKLNQLENEASGKVVDSFLNYETVKYCGNEATEVEKYLNLQKDYEKTAITSQISLGALNFGQFMIFTIAMTSSMLMTVHGIHFGNFTVGDLVMVNQLLFQLSIPLNFLGTIYREVTQAIADMETMFTELERESLVKELPGAPDLMVTEGRIEFENVTFSYDKAAGSHVVIRNLSFTVDPGMTLGVCGLSGSGKSTLVKLLYRFYDPDEGRILIDRQDIKMVTLRSLRRHIGIVPQETILFNDTILYNVQYGNLKASKEEVEKVIELAHLTDTVSKLKQGVATLVGERGVRLSGGEKQRISIARTMLKKPNILLCDEPTSSLDTTTEATIMSALMKFSQNMSSIIIAHRLSTIQQADRILVLDAHGTLAESGTHWELLELGGLYANMWSRLQTNEQSHHHHHQQQLTGIDNPSSAL